MPAGVRSVSGAIAAEGLNSARTERSALIVTGHGTVPEQSPLQPEKTEPGSGMAVSVNETALV